MAINGIFVPPATSLCVILKGAAINRPDYEFQIYWSNMFTASAVVTPFYLSLVSATIPNLIYSSRNTCPGSSTMLDLYPPGYDVDKTTILIDFVLPKEKFTVNTKCLCSLQLNIY